jgi:tol-pal system protein YbgF
MKRFFHAALLGMTLLVLTGCATTTGAVQPKAAPSAESERLNQQQQAFSRQIEQLQDNLLLLEARVLDQQTVLEQLRTALQAQKVTTAGEKTGAHAPPTANSAPDILGRPPLSPTETYLQAFSDYASGRYIQAILGFENFLRHFPENDYAANAQYWLGECFLAQQLFPRAAEEFQKTFSRYPQGAKTPDALYKLAFTFTQMNQPDRATATLQTLRQRYPGSAAARQSEQER